MPLRLLSANSSWLKGRKYLAARVALFAAACVLIVSAVLMLNATNQQNLRNQQVASQMVQTDTRAEVLVLASYDDADTATTLQRDGLLDLLRRSSVAADVEYIDARATAQNANATNTAAYGNALASTTWGEAIASKVAAHGPYSAVIAIDDDALCFVEATRNSLFSSTPMVFMGVNDVAHANVAFQAGYATGLLEAYNTRNTIETAAAMRPNATNMLVITDNTATGTGNRAQFEQAIADNNDIFAGYTIEYANASRLSRADLAQQLTDTTDDTVVVYLDANADSAGNAYDTDQTAYFLSQASAQPIFAIGLAGVGEGFAGSGFIDYEQEGMRAGEMVVAVLNGTRPADIPVETFTSDGAVFDTQVLGDYGINASLVPVSATTVNASGLSVDSLRTVFLPVILLILGIVCIAAFAFMGYRRTVVQMTDIVTQHNALERRFYTDNLTEMPNMQWLTAFAANEASARVKAIVGIDLMDIDLLDETRGPSTSDDVVKTVAERLSGLEKSFLVRPGRSQFIIGTERELKRGGKFLNELEYLLSQPVPVGGMDTVGVGSASSAAAGSSTSTNASASNRSSSAATADTVILTPCIGVFNRERGMSIEEMVSGVELAIRQAEESGNTQEVTFYDHHMREAEESKLAITSCLREAITQDDPHVLYQPQIELATNKVVGYEALVRLRGEPYPPDQFIPIAEASDQIIEIDRIVTQKVAQQLATWKKRKQRMVPVSINHSFGQLRDEKYVGHAKAALEKNRIATRFLRIEIKEQLFLNNIARATSFFDELRNDGFGITIDGFGAGYTSLARVMQIPADVIKIDRSLTEGFLQGGDASVIANLVRLVHGAEKKVVIEGVETAEQLQMCIEVGCDIVQGFYFSEPLLPEKALQYKPPKIAYTPIGDGVDSVPVQKGDMRAEEPESKEELEKPEPKPEPEPELAVAAEPVMDPEADKLEGDIPESEPATAVEAEPKEEPADEEPAVDPEAVDPEADKLEGDIPEEVLASPNDTDGDEPASLENSVARKSINARISAATSGVAAKVAARSATTLEVVDPEADKLEGDIPEDSSDSSGASDASEV